MQLRLHTGKPSSEPTVCCSSRRRPWYRAIPLRAIRQREPLQRRGAHDAGCSSVAVAASTSHRRRQWIVTLNQEASRPRPRSDDQIAEQFVVRPRTRRQALMPRRLHGPSHLDVSPTRSASTPRVRCTPTRQLGRPYRRRWSLRPAVSRPDPLWRRLSCTLNRRCRPSSCRCRRPDVIRICSVTTGRLRTTRTQAAVVSTGVCRRRRRQHVDTTASSWSRTTAAARQRHSDHYITSAFCRRSHRGPSRRRATRAVGGEHRDITCCIADRRRAAARRRHQTTSTTSTTTTTIVNANITRHGMSDVTWWRSVNDLRAATPYTSDSVLPVSLLTFWGPLLPYGYSYKASCSGKPGETVICNFWHPCTLTLRAERQ